MCNSEAEGGQRCAGHTRPRYEAATRVLNAASGTEAPLAAAVEDAWVQAAAEYASTPEGRDRLNDARDEAASQGWVKAAARTRTALAKGNALRDTNDQIRRVRENRAAAALAEAEADAKAEAEARGYGMNPIRVAEPVDETLSLEDAKARRGDIHHLLSPIIGDLRMAAADGEPPTAKELAGWAARLRHAMDVADAMVGEEPMRVQMARFKAEAAAR